MLRAYLEHRQAGGGVEVKETTTYAKVRWEISSPTDASVREALGCLPLIASRDEYELLLDTGEAHLSVTRDSPADDAGLQRLFSEVAAVDVVAVDLTIRKKVVDRRASVYFADSMADYFEQAPLLDAVACIAGMLDVWLQFEVFEAVQPFFTASIGFAPVGEMVPHTLDSVRAEKLEAFRNNSNGSGLPPGILPSDLYLQKRSELAAYNRFFDQASAVLCLAFIASTSELRTPDLLSFKLYGYKAVVSVDVPASSLVPSLKVLHEIYAWSYEGGSAADKLGLVRNVVSLHLDASGHPQFDEFVRDAIHSNYQIYLKGNIQTYLEVKNKLADLLLDSVERTSKLADDVFDSFKNNVFVVATFLLTVVVVNGLKDTGFASIFSGAYLLLVVFLAICSGFWMWLVQGDAYSRYQTSTEAMEGVLRTNYEKFLLKAEIDASLKPTLKRTKGVLKLRIRKYCVWWTCLLALFVGFFVLGYILFPAESASLSKLGVDGAAAAPAQPSTGEVASPQSTGTGKQGDVAKPSVEAASKPSSVTRAPSRQVKAQAQNIQMPAAGEPD